MNQVNSVGDDDKSLDMLKNPTGTFYPLPPLKIFRTERFNHPDPDVGYADVPVANIWLESRRVDLESIAPLLNGLQTVLDGGHKEPKGLYDSPKETQVEDMIYWFSQLGSLFYEEDLGEKLIVERLNNLIENAKNLSAVLSGTSNTGLYHWYNGVYFKEAEFSPREGGFGRSLRQFDFIYPDVDSLCGYSMYRIYCENKRKGKDRINPYAQGLIVPKVFPTGQRVERLPADSPLFGSIYDGRVVEADFTFVPYTDIAGAHDIHSPSPRTDRVLVALRVNEKGFHVLEACYPPFTMGFRVMSTEFEMIDIIKKGRRNIVRLKPSEDCWSNYYLENPEKYQGEAVEY